MSARNLQYEIKLHFRQKRWVQLLPPTPTIYVLMSMNFSTKRADVRDFMTQIETLNFHRKLQKGLIALASSWDNIIGGNFKLKIEM